MKKLKLMNIVTIAAFSLMSVSILMTPFSATFDPTNGKKFVNYMVFVLFWGGLIAAIVSTVMASSARKKINDNNKSGLPGIISFFKNKESIISIVVCIIGIIALLVSGLFTARPKMVLQFAGLFCSVLGFSLHCVFDGLNYRALKYKKETNKNEEETK